MQFQIKKLIPRSVKQSLKEVDRECRLALALAQFRRLEGQPPSHELLVRCEEGWGNNDYRAIGGYLEEVVTCAIASNGPILEIGSGLTTLLLGLIAQHSGTRVWTLEHHPKYFRHTQSKLSRYKIVGVKLILAPLQDYGDFAWYASSEFETMPDDFQLVIADGPPGTTKGGRLGLMSLMRNRIASNAKILLDDTERPGEQNVLRQWQEDYDISYRMRTREGRAWAICTLTGTQSEATHDIGG